MSFFANQNTKTNWMGSPAGAPSDGAATNTPGLKLDPCTRTTKIGLNPDTGKNIFFLSGMDREFLQVGYLMVDGAWTDRIKEIYGFDVETMKEVQSLSSGGLKGQQLKAADAKVEIRQYYKYYDKYGKFRSGFVRSPVRLTRQGGAAGAFELFRLIYDEVRKWEQSSDRQHIVRDAVYLRDALTLLQSVILELPEEFDGTALGDLANYLCDGRLPGEEGNRHAYNSSLYTTMIRRIGADIKHNQGAFVFRDKFISREEVLYPEADVGAGEQMDADSNPPIRVYKQYTVKATCPGSLRAYQAWKERFMFMDKMMGPPSKATNTR